MIASTGPQLAAALTRTGADLARAGAPPAHSWRPTGPQLAAALVRTGADLARSGAQATRLEVGSHFPVLTPAGHFEVLGHR